MEAIDCYSATGDHVSHGFIHLIAIQRKRIEFLVRNQILCDGLHTIAIRVFMPIRLEQTVTLNIKIKF